MTYRYELAKQAVAKEDFSRLVKRLFWLISIYLIFPLIDVPLLGLSLSAILFVVVVAEAVLKPPVPWPPEYRPFIILAGLIWVGMVLSLIANGFSRGGAGFDTVGIQTVIRYAYWLLIFLVVAFVVKTGELIPSLSRLFGWGVLILALVRWWEAIAFGSLGAEFNLRVMTQNSYGFQFSVFSPYLLGLAVSEKEGKKTIAIIGNIILWGAVAMNGSRGSWIGIASGVLVLFMIMLLSGWRKIGRLAGFLILITGLALFVFASSSQVSEAVIDRLNTFKTLEQDKSYTIRLLMNQKAQRLFEQSPLFGTGPGGFRVSSVELDIPQILRYTDQEHFDSKSAHNAYLSFLAENGLAGSVPLALLLIYMAAAGMKAAVSLVRRGQYWGVIVYTSFIGMSVHMWAISALTSTLTWFVYGLVVAMIILSRSGLQEVR